MKPPSFDYLEAKSVDEAIQALASTEDSKALAGGQSLVPLLNFRLARPALLVDLNRLGELSYLRREDGVLRIGTMTRQSDLERSQLVARDWPLLRQGVRYVAHSHYATIPRYTELTPEQEMELRDLGLRRITDTFLPENESVRLIEPHLLKMWKLASQKGQRYFCCPNQAALTLHSWSSSTVASNWAAHRT